MECGPLVLSRAWGSSGADQGGGVSPMAVSAGGVGGLTNSGQTLHTACSLHGLRLADPAPLRQLPQGRLQAAVGEELLANGLRLLLALGTDAQVGVAILEVNGELVELGHR